MRFAIVGTGGVGGYFGGLLAHAGHDVTFIARGDHLRAIRQEGLRVLSAHGDFYVRPAQATDDGTGVGPVDWVIFTVKTYQAGPAMEAMRPLVGPDTSILTLQNGVETPESLASHYGQDRVVPGAVWVVSAVEAPGVIRQASPYRRLVFGESSGPANPRTRRLFDAFAPTGPQVEVAEDIHRVLWTKFLFIASFSGLSSVIRLPAEDVRALPETRAVLLAAMREVEAVARAKGVTLDADVVEKTMRFVDDLAPGTTSSMQRDADAGRRLEVDAMSGYLSRTGRETGVPTPAHDFIYAVLKPLDLRAARRA